MSKKLTMPMSIQSIFNLIVYKINFLNKRNPLKNIIFLLFQLQYHIIQKALCVLIIYWCLLGMYLLMYC